MKLFDTDVQGDLSVSRNSSVGGNHHVNGNSVVDHDMIVKGWLEATNIKGPDKGLFRTAELLKKAHPKPQAGWLALVGETLPAELYVVENGRWVGTGNMTGLPTPSVAFVDRGAWDKDSIYYFETLNPDTGIRETSDVWHYGCKYRCCRTGTRQEPGWFSTDWVMIEGNPEFRVDFEPTDYLFDPDRFEVDLVIVATMYNQNITDDILDRDVVWTRYSEDNAGNPRVASDSIWAVKRAGAGKRLHLTREDCDFTGFGPEKLTFIATVTLRDTPGAPELTAQASFEY